MDAAMRTGIGVADALKALRTLDVDARTLNECDLLLATDPATGRTTGEPVTDTFSHPTQDLLDIPWRAAEA